VGRRQSEQTWDKLGIPFQGALKQVARVKHPLSIGRLAKEPPAAHGQIDCVRVVRMGKLCPMCLGGDELQAERIDYSSGHLVLEGRNVAHFVLEPFAPQLAAGAAVD
jgi:hypothetical protein